MTIAGLTENQILCLTVLAASRGLGYDPSTWTLGSLAATTKVMDTLVTLGLAAKDATYDITDAGVAKIDVLFA